MGQLEKYGLYVLCLVIFLILGVTLWGGGDTASPARKQEAQTPMRAPNPVTPPPTTPAPSPAVEPKVVDITGLLQPEARGNEPKKNAPVADAPKAGDAPKGPAGETTKEPVGEAKATTYKVQTGDTFESIARSKLGDPKRQTEIAKLNPTVKANRMRVGQELVLPGAKPADKATEPAIDASAKKSATPKEASAKAKAAESKTAESKTAESKAAESKTADAKQSSKDVGADRSYVVGKGDTFGRIAQTQLGSSKRVEEIRELNPNVDPLFLRVGQRIKLPKK
jgi:LysM repeat protein